MNMDKTREAASASERSTDSEEGHRGTHLPVVLPGLQGCKAAAPDLHQQIFQCLN